MDIRTGILIKKTHMGLERTELFHSFALTRANKIFWMLKKIKKRNKSFFPTKFREDISQEQKGVLIDAMSLYDGRNKNIKLFENRSIKRPDHAYNSKSEPNEYDRVQEYERRKSDGVKKSE